jgi:hypothetical protein
MTTTPPGTQQSQPSHASGPIGHRRPVGKQILLAIVTLGLYGVYWCT